MHVFYLGETSSAMDSWLWSQADEGCLEQVPKNSPSSHQQSLHESETWAMVADKFKHIHSNYDPQYQRKRKLSQTPFSQSLASRIYIQCSVPVDLGEYFNFNALLFHT